MVRFNVRRGAQHGWRRADWRWQLASPLGESLPHEALEADALLAAAADYRRQLAHAEAKAARRQPCVHAAVAIWENASLRRRLMLLALGGCDASQIAASLGEDASIVTAALDLFCDVGGRLDAPGWICAAVIDPVEQAGDTDLAAALKLAFFGGPLVAQAIVDAGERLPLDQAARLFDAHLLLHLKAQAALARPLRDERNRVEFVKAFLHYLAKSERLTLERDKLQHRCQRQLPRHEQATPPVAATGEVLTPRVVVADAEAA